VRILNWEGVKGVPNKRQKVKARYKQKTQIGGTVISWVSPVELKVGWGKGYLPFLGRK